MLQWGHDREVVEILVHEAVQGVAEPASMGPRL